MIQQHIPRLEDLPYWSSPPIQFVFEKSAPLLAGSYEWLPVPAVLTPLRPIIDNALYFFRSISLAADISELDFESAITDTPKFYTYLSGDAKSVLFREPILMNKFYDQFDYRMTFLRSKGANQLFASFSGVLLQTAALIGKTSVTLKAVISAQEIVDDNFINEFQNRSYLQGNKERG